VKTRRTSKRIALVVAVAVAAIGVVWSARPVAALNFTRMTTGMVGVARGQTFRANVVNTGEARGFVINWAVLNAAGQTLAASREPTTLTLGQAAFFDFHFDEFPTETIRGEFRALVVIHGSSVDTPNVIVTGEVFDDDTGKTTSTQRFEECACGAQ
jgi:hypothetical protein